MKNKEIQAWLKTPENDRDFAQGCELYAKYGNNPRLKSLIFKPQNNTPGHLRTLSYELEKLLDKEKKTVVKNITKPKPTQQTQFQENKSQPEKPKPQKTVNLDKLSPKGFLRQNFPKIKFAEIPDPLKILVVDAISLFSKAQEAKEKREIAKTDTERHKYNTIVIESMDENSLIWEELNYYQKNKKILGKHPKLSHKSWLEELQEMSKTELYKKDKNLPTYISKAQKAISENPDKPKIVERKQSLLKKYEFQQKHIKRLLGI